MIDVQCGNQFLEPWFIAFFLFFINTGEGVNILAHLGGLVFGLIARLLNCSKTQTRPSRKDSDSHILLLCRFSWVECRLQLLLCCRLLGTALFSGKQAQLFQALKHHSDCAKPLLRHL